MKSLKTGRPRDDVWKCYTLQNNSNKRYLCNYCSKEYHTPTAIALKAHFSNNIYSRRYKTTLCKDNSDDVEKFKVIYSKYFELKFADTPVQKPTSKKRQRQEIESRDANRINQQNHMSMNASDNKSSKNRGKKYDHLDHESNSILQSKEDCDNDFFSRFSP